MTNDEAAQKPCADCHVQAGNLEIRKRQLCSDCFQKYVSSKVLKRMESYRFKYQDQSGKRKKLFLPISGGVSSLVLLQVLDAQVKKQLRQQGRAAFDLVTGHVRVPRSTADKAEEEVELYSWWKRTGEIFDGHQNLPIHALENILDHDTTLESDLEQLDLRRKPDEDNQSFIRRVLDSPSTVTSRVDVEQILLQRHIIALAKQNECESIVWGHSDTRLAAKALSEVAKGRGGAVPNGIADGPSPFELTFNYPLRDLFKTELDLYLRSFGQKYQPCLLEEDSEASNGPVVSIRNTSIDSLLTTYISSQGEKYPSIMANVVKTASKLQTPLPKTFEQCRFCGMPVTNQEYRALCYGCERMKLDLKT